MILERGASMNSKPEGVIWSKHKAVSSVQIILTNVFYKYVIWAKYEDFLNLSLVLFGNYSIKLITTFCIVCIILDWNLRKID